MRQERTHQSIEEILEGSSLTYFNNLHTDSRLDRFFEESPSETSFSFSSLSHSNQPLLKGTLDHNTVSDGKEATAFTVRGSIEKLRNNNMPLFTIDISANPDSNQPSQSANILLQPDDSITVYDRKNDYSYLITKEEFIDLSLRIADLPPAQVRRTMKLLRLQNMFDNIEAFYPFWLEVAEGSTDGITTTTQVADYCVEQNESIDRRVRIGRRESEHTTFSAVDLSIEHSIQQFSTDHEIVTRLDLTYLSTTQDSQDAERRIFEACAPQEMRLSRIQFFDNSSEPVSVTKLDALDPDLLQQFRAITEIALNTTEEQL